jgi:hypothetical protein
MYIFSKKSQAYSYTAIYKVTTGLQPSLYISNIPKALKRTSTEGNFCMLSKREMAGVLIFATAASRY